MKYFILTITFFTVILLLVAGSLFYSSRVFWMNNKEEVSGRLEYLNNGLEQEKEELFLSPGLKKCENSVIYDRNLRVIGEYSTGRRKIISKNKIPPFLVSTLLLMEDSKFYTHNGFDYRTITGLLFEDMKVLPFIHRGYTITQELSKVLFSDRKKTIKRRISRLFCTSEIENKYSKDEILSYFFNSVYLGHFNYGIENAAQFYFNKDVSRLNQFEAALIVAIIHDPDRFSPLLYPERSMKRHKIVLNKLTGKGIIDTQIVINGFDNFWENFASFEHQPVVSLWEIEKNYAPYFIEYVRQELKTNLSIEILQRGGLRVYTTLDLEKQNIAEQVLWEGLKRQSLRTGGITGMREAKVEGAFIALNPRNGHVLAMVGGSGYKSNNQFNRAVYAKRQIGSAFKPFVYAAAFETAGYTKDTRYVDKPLEIETKDGLWRPDNYNNAYYGDVSLEFAMKKSLNSVAIQLIQEIGPEKVIDILVSALDLEKKDGKQRFRPYPSVALGVYSFSPLEIVRAYSIFPNGGEKVFPMSIFRIDDYKGNSLIDNESEIKNIKTLYAAHGKMRVIEINTADTINSILEEVLKEGGTAHEALLASDFVVKGSGKTGTTNNYTDAWFIGYTDEIIAAVWVGFDDPSYTLGEGQTGGVAAAPIWAAFMKKH